MDTLQALDVENYDAANSILDQMDDQYKANGYFGNTGIYCIELQASSTSDLATVGYLWYYQSLAQYDADGGPQYME